MQGLRSTYCSCANGLPESSDKLLVVPNHTQDVAIEKNCKDALVGDLFAGQQMEVFNTGVESQPHNRTLVHLNNPYYPLDILFVFCLSLEYLLSSDYDNGN
jgi:hypothetical protein